MALLYNNFNLVQPYVRGALADCISGLGRESNPDRSPSGHDSLPDCRHIEFLRFKPRSGCRESNPDRSLPKRVHYHYATPRPRVKTNKKSKLDVPHTSTLPLCYAPLNVWETFNASDTMYQFITHFTTISKLNY